MAKGRLADVYAPSVQQDTVRKQVNLELHLDGFTIVVDAANAYHHGKPCDPRSPNGRHICALAKGVELLDLDHTRFAAGMKTVLGIPGNVPGLQNAGVVWGEDFGMFLADEGFTASAARSSTLRKAGAWEGIVPSIREAAFSHGDAYHRGNWEFPLEPQSL